MQASLDRLCWLFTLTGVLFSFFFFVGFAPVGDAVCGQARELWLARFLPMVVKPLPWRSQYGGGYLLWRSNVMRTRLGIQQAAIADAERADPTTNHQVRPLLPLGLVVFPTRFCDWSCVCKRVELLPECPAAIFPKVLVLLFGLAVCCIAQPLGKAAAHKSSRQRCLL